MVATACGIGPDHRGEIGIVHLIQRNVELIGDGIRGRGQVQGQGQGQGQGLATNILARDIGADQLPPRLLRLIIIALRGRINTGTEVGVEKGLIKSQKRGRKNIKRIKKR